MRQCLKISAIKCSQWLVKESFLGPFLLTSIKHRYDQKLRRRPPTTRSLPGAHEEKNFYSDIL